MAFRSDCIDNRHRYRLNVEGHHFRLLTGTAGAQEKHFETFFPHWEAEVELRVPLDRESEA
jgi:hypothetical protein